LENVIENSDIITFADSLLSYLAVRLIFENSGYKVRSSLQLENVFDSLVLNFFNNFLLNGEIKKTLKEISGNIGEQKVFIEKIGKEDFKSHCYFFDCKRLGPLAKELRKEFQLQRIRNFGFGFANYIKVCSEGKHGYVEEDISECETHKRDLSEHKNVFLIHEKCYDVLANEERTGYVLEQYVYIKIREIIAKKSLNFITFRNVQFIGKDDCVEFDIFCIPVGDFFKKMLIVECKSTCNNNDVFSFKNAIEKVFRDNVQYIYPAIVFLNNRAQEKSSDIPLYPANEVEELIENYVKDSIQCI